MKQIIRDDWKRFLPNLLMFAMTLVILELFVGFGILSKNDKQVTTAISLFFFIMLIMLAMMIALAGKIFLGDLRNPGILQAWKKEERSLVSVVVCKTTVYTCLLYLLELLYAGVLVLDVLWIYGAFPNERKALDELFAKLSGKESGFEGIHATQLLEYLAIAFSAVALAYFTITMAYNIFTKSRYVGILAGVFYVLLAYFFIRVHLEIVKNITPASVQSLAGVAVQAVIGAILLAVTIGSVKKHQWDVQEE